MMTNDEAKRMRENYENRALYEYDVDANNAGALANWIVHGIPGGGFLHAVLTNDLTEAFSRADMTSRASLFNIVQFLYNAAPRDCWQTTENVANWQGLRSIEHVHP